MMAFMTTLKKSFKKILKTQMLQGLLPASVCSPAGMAVWATLMYGIVTSRFRFPFLADDYIFLMRSYDPHFQLKDFGNLLIQRPVFAILNFLTFKHHIFEHTQILFYVYFYLHTWGLMRLLRELVTQLDSRRAFLVQSSPVWVLFCLGLCFYSGFFEVLFMALNLPYSLGTLLLSFAWTSRKKQIRILMMSVAFCTFETYLLPALLIPWLPYVLWVPGMSADLKKQGFQKNFESSVEWFLACLLYVGIRGLLCVWIPEGAYPFTFQPSHWFAQGWMHAQLLFTLNFYKIYWFETALFWVSIILVLMQVKPQQRVWSVMIFLCGPLLASAHIILIDYYAPRAIHGGELVLLLILGSLFFCGIVPQKIKGIQKIAVAMLWIALSLQLTIIFHTRSIHQNRIQSLEKEWVTQMEACQAPCVLKMGHLGRGFLRDWILPPYSWQPFLEWLKKAHGISKSIQFL